MALNEKILKKCRYCGKEVQRLDMHIINHHPMVLEKIDETPQDSPNSAPIARPLEQNRGMQDINSMVREKLEIMLNIKLIEMMSRSPDTSLQSISQQLNPPQPMGLREIKEFHDMVYKEKDQRDIEIPETGNQWIDLATAAIPLVRDMLQKKQEVKQNGKLGIIEGGDLQVLKPIQLETTIDREQPISFGEEPRIIGETEQRNKNSIEGTSNGA